MKRGLTTDHSTTNTDANASSSQLPRGTAVLSLRPPTIQQNFKYSNVGKLGTGYTFSDEAKLRINSARKRQYSNTSKQSANR